MLPDSAAVQPYSVFRPTGYSSLARLDFGRGPSPFDVDWHLTQVRIESDSCQGLNDVLTVTLPAPIVGDVSPEDFSVRVCRVSHNTHEPEHQDGQQLHAHEVVLDDCEVVVPSCARLQLEEEPRERRTVLLFGQFAQIENETAIYAPSTDNLKSITFLVDSNRTEFYGEFESGTGIGWGLDPDLVSFYGEGPFLSDIALHNLSAPLNSAAADPTGCAALHPSATYAVRLLFDSAVHERAADGSLVPFGTDATAAASIFSARTGDDGETPSPDQVVGVAGVPGGSAVEVCIKAAGGEPQVEAVVITCTPTAPLSPAGYPCSSPIKAFLRSEADQRAGRDPATFADGHTIEFCLSAKGHCGVAPKGRGIAWRSALSGAAVVLAAAVLLAGIGLIG